MIEIWIKPSSTWEQLDIDEGTIIALTFQLANIGDAQIYANRTNNYSLPKTAQNLLKIQNAQIPNSTGVVQYSKTEAKIIIDGINILSQMGSAYMIINTIKDFIDITIYSGNFDIISTLGEKRLKDLDLSTWDRKWNTATINARKAATVKYKYPLINWFSDDPHTPEMDNANRTMYVKYYKPAAFLASLIDLIIVDNGFTYGSFTSPVLLSDLFNKILITCTSHKTPTDYETGTAVITVPQSPLSSGTHNIVFDAVTGEFFILANGRYTVTATNTVNGDFTCDVGLTSPTPDVIGIGLQISDVTSGDTVFFENQSIPNTGSNIVQIAYSPDLDLIDGQVLQFQLYFTSFTGTSTATIQTTNLVMTAKADGNIGIGYDFPIAYNLPDITQIQLLKSFLQMFALFMKQSGDGTILFKSIDELITDCNDSTKYNDWSDKFAPDEQSEFGFVTELAQKNIVKYTEDDTLVGTINDSYITVSDKTIQAEKTYIELPFAASDKSIRLIGLELPYIKDIAEFDWIENTKPRLLLDRIVTPTGTGLLVKDGLTPDLTISTNFPMCYFNTPNTQYSGEAITDELSWDYLLATNYVGFSQVYLRPKIVKQKFWLSIMDIYNLDQFIPIFCEQLGGYYIVMKVTNWINGQSTECELLKIK